MATKKVKRTGRLGSRYGVGIRKRLLKIESEQFAPHNCPECGAPKVKRKAPGIFYCKKCGYEFAGGAYVPETMSGTIVKKMVSQKVFLPNLRNLIEAKEKAPVQAEANADSEARPKHGKKEKKHAKEKTEKNPGEIKDD
ncbi:MAG: 50S ribosomal protein L37ae [Candidatus ainarchaeum sp.]|nr:50S ribosomal protein L37ae [Candidatus ainarchaeum sp.]